MKGCDPRENNQGNRKPERSLSRGEKTYLIPFPKKEIFNYFLWFFREDDVRESRVIGKSNITNVTMVFLAFLQD